MMNWRRLWYSSAEKKTLCAKSYRMGKTHTFIRSAAFKCCRRAPAIAFMLDIVVDGRHMKVEWQKRVWGGDLTILKRLNTVRGRILQYIVRLDDYIACAEIWTIIIPSDICTREMNNMKGFVVVVGDRLQFNIIDMFFFLGSSNLSKYYIKSKLYTVLINSIDWMY